METLPNGMTFITAGFKWSIGSPHFSQLYTDHGRKGRILLFNFNTPEKGVTELSFDEDFDQSTFHPHGISVIQNKDTGKITLFVVNHTPDEDRIERFEFIEEKMMLEHELSYIDEAINIANDVAATSENSFYFTNYCYSRSSLGYLIEAIVLLLPWGNVVYFDGAHYSEVVDGLLMPNGILLSKDKKYAYVANGILSSLSVFEREANNHLEISQEFQLHASPDNFLIEPKSGNLLVGVHPVLHQTGAHLEAPDLHRAPTKVLMVHMKNSSFADGITELYSDEGNNISAGSVASVYDNKMLIGSVVDKLLYCEVRTLE
ncbi:serum paraoxonase/arylesterase 2-like isoform X2 [Mercenaria mercenaria]|nr:serum paraoxonase/arylesterase 2-like isoform X2 [Mercenaria mercenaria]XP_053385523.1 serum paraoxonase/arylesterase 2-like isoform X2 [Mercenaria mercenaria]XP_053385524.1 serum paraoxonase/arylesterase 2-like isoform X2 [Mercenaria mercenaria]